MPLQQTHPHDTLVSEEVKEILGAPPSGMLRWGNTVLLASLIIIGLVCSLIQYPDVVQGTAVVIPEEKALDIYLQPKQELHLFELKDGQPVRKGDVLFVAGKKVWNTSQTRSVDTVIAPFDGTVVIQRTIREALTSPKATLLLTLVPEGGSYQVDALLPERSYAKVKLGQKVIINLNTFPSEDFGDLTGEVVSKPLADRNGHVMVEIRIDPSLVTTYRRKLPLYREAKGNVKIITAERRLVEHLLKTDIVF